MSATHALGAVLLLALAGCASTPMPRPDQAGGVSRAAQQPIRDLSLLREQAPDVLVRAAADPYAVGQSACADLRGEIADLEAALGPDLHAGQTPDRIISVDGLATGLVGDAVSLPFRGAIRYVSGAERRDRDIRAAVLAGMVRRGFLKGRANGLGCAAAQP